MKKIIIFFLLISLNNKGKAKKEKAKVMPNYQTDKKNLIQKEQKNK